MAVEPTRRIFTIREYERMADAGVLAPDDRVELIEGEILEMSPIHPPHAGAVNRLNQLLVAGVGDRGVVTVQNPLYIPPRSAPQPDLMVLRPRDDFYGTRHPHPEDVLLLVEVADSSRRFDRRVKIPLYATAGIPEAWLVDLVEGVVEVHRAPSPDGYTEAWRTTEPVAPDAFPDLMVDALP